MLPYWLLFSVFAAGAVGHTRRRQAGEQAVPLLPIAAALAAAMIGFRFEAGADWFNYIGLLRVISYLDPGEALLITDPGYGLLNWLAAKAGLEIWAVNLVCGALLAWGLLKFARQQPNPWLAALVAVPYLIIVVAMGYSRQGVAVGLVLAALAAFERHSLVRFGFYIVVAAAFHKSAVVVVPLVALASVRHRFAIYACLGSLALILFYIFVGGDLSRLSAVYIEAEFSSQGAAIRVAMGLVPAMIFLAFQKRFRLSEPQRLLWRNFSYAAVLMLVLLLATPSSTAVDRIALYLIPLQIFVLSRLPEVFPERGGADRKLALAVVLYSAVVQFVWLNYAEHSKYWLPYRAYFISDTSPAAKIEGLYEF